MARRRFAPTLLILLSSLIFSSTARLHHHGQPPATANDRFWEDLVVESGSSFSDEIAAPLTTTTEAQCDCADKKDTNDVVRREAAKIAQPRYIVVYRNIPDNPRSPLTYQFDPQPYTFEEVYGVPWSSDVEQLLGSHVGGIVFEEDPAQRTNLPQNTHNKQQDAQLQQPSEGLEPEFRRTQEAPVAVERGSDARAPPPAAVDYRHVQPAPYDDYYANRKSGIEEPERYERRPLHTPPSPARNQRRHFQKQRVYLSQRATGTASATAVAAKDGGARVKETGKDGRGRKPLQRQFTLTKQHNSGQFAVRRSRHAVRPIPADQGESRARLVKSPPPLHAVVAKRGGISGGRKLLEKLGKLQSSATTTKTATLHEDDRPLLPFKTRLPPALNTTASQPKSKATIHAFLKRIVGTPRALFQPPGNFTSSHLEAAAVVPITMHPTTASPSDRHHRLVSTKPTATVRNSVEQDIVAFFKAVEMAESQRTDKLLTTGMATSAGEIPKKL